MKIEITPLKKGTKIQLKVKYKQVLILKQMIGPHNNN
jgi:hypothetical protein